LVKLGLFLRRNLHEEDWARRAIICSRGVTGAANVTVRWFGVIALLANMTAWGAAGTTSGSSVVMGSPQEEGYSWASKNV
jgi:hypothetical protein